MRNSIKLWNLLRALIMRGRGGWQPIETAPKDGSVLVLYGRCQWDADMKKSNPKVCIGSWVSESGWSDHEIDDDDDDIVDDRTFMTSTNNPYSDICHATHWMPLPAAPTRTNS
jgi:hypothetical protein